LNDEGAPKTSGFDDSGPFADTPPAGGVTLDSALREFGPAAFDDLIPRLRSLAADLDQAHARGFVHGRLHPSRIIVTNDATYLIGRRVPAGGALTPAQDQAAFAVIAYEWMFGRRVSPGAAVAPSPPSGVDRGALSQALTRALSLDRDRQFPSIGDFVSALENSQTLLLPLATAEEDPVEPFIPESLDSRAAAKTADSPAQAAVAAPGPVPDFDTIDRGTGDEPPQVVASTSAAAAASYVTADSSADPVSAMTALRRAPQRFSGLALILATIVGAVLGFAAGYMARPRALQMSPAVGAPGAPSAKSAPSAKGAPAATGAELALDDSKPERPATPARVAPVAPAKIGRLLVRSTPAGAAVAVDGVAKGVTPLAIRDLDLGSRDITLTHRGYDTEARRIVLSKARPSRSVEVRLSASAPPGRSGESAPSARGGPGAPRPSTPASFGKPPATTGVLAVESQPPGALVLVNGQPSGTTPLTMNDMTPGEYRVTMRLKGFRDFATTVQVVAGERARAAARLTEQEQE
jgi:hypothetical protein